MAEEAANVSEFLDVDLGILWTPPAGGLAGIWQLPLNHRFQKGFIWHDCMYDMAYSGLAVWPTSKPADRGAYRMFLHAANNEEMYELLALGFYIAMRRHGRRHWTPNGDPATLRRIYEAQKAAGVPLTPNTIGLEGT